VRSYRQADRVDSTHPALPGHFPGNPIVPGVLLLARVLKVAAAAWNARAGTVKVAKFHARLMPDEDFAIELEGEKSDARFRVVRGETLIATGVLKLECMLAG
jgi:3-hydroxymyristoyl/3-hydroxydecanoyl-(acyl carrier protein) dehydratase